MRSEKYQTSPLSEMMWSCKCPPHVSKNLNPHIEPDEQHYYKERYDLEPTCT